MKKSEKKRCYQGKGQCSTEQNMVNIVGQGKMRFNKMLTCQKATTNTSKIPYQK